MVPCTSRTIRHSCYLINVAVESVQRFDVDVEVVQAAVVEGVHDLPHHGGRGARLGLGGVRGAVRRRPGDAAPLEDERRTHGVRRRLRSGIGWRHVGRGHPLKGTRRKSEAL